MLLQSHVRSVHTATPSVSTESHPYPTPSAFHVAIPSRTCCLPVLPPCGTTLSGTFTASWTAFLRPGEDGHGPVSRTYIIILCLCKSWPDSRTYIIILYLYKSWPDPRTYIIILSLCKSWPDSRTYIIILYLCKSLTRPTDLYNYTVSM